MAEKIPLTVRALTKYIKLKFDYDGNLQNVLLKGEISNFKRHSRGHFYFSIKDEDAQINAVMFAHVAKSVQFEPTNGMQVIVTGNVSVYEVAGSYSIHVKKMTEDGVGNLYVAFNQMKERLADQGLFDELHKQELPRLPRSVGVITSPTGAAVKDIISTIKRRSPNVQIYVYKALVQGEQAAADIVEKIKMANEQGLVDVLIVGRGGGSIEDLWAFNEEIVARAIFSSELPVISAVGHETDFTIADFVADLRAATPTAAAEIAAPNIVDIVTHLRGLQSRLNRGLQNITKLKGIALQRLSNHYIMKNPRALFESRILRLSQLEKGLNYNLEQKLAEAKRRLEILTKGLQTFEPSRHTTGARQRLVHLDEMLAQVAMKKLDETKQRYFILNTKLELLNPLSVLNKGYAVATSEAGDVISNIGQLSVGTKISVRVSDGEFVATVDGVNNKKVNNEQ